MIHSVEEHLLGERVSGVPWLRSGALAFLSLVRSSGVVPGLLVCGSVLRANHWAKPRISSLATKSFLVSEQPSLLWMAQGSTARIEKAFPTTAAAS
jgi:hypothetical protein